MVTAVRPRASGFTLVEVQVAMVVLGAGVLVIAASTAAASGLLHRADARDRAVTEAAAVLDSLAAEPDPEGGERDRHPARLRWEVVPDGATRLVRLVTTTPSDPSAQGTVFEMRWTPPPPSLARIP